MIKKHKLFRPSLLFGFALLYLLSLTFSVFLPTTQVHAANKTLAEKAAAYAAGRAIVACADHGGVGWQQTTFSGSDYSLAAVESGDIWEQTIRLSPVSGAGLPAGYLVDTTDGITDCTNNGDVVQLFNAIGHKDTTGQLMIDAGIMTLSEDKAGYNLTDKSDGERASALKTKIEAEFGINLSNPMPNDMAYLALSQAFFKGCQPKEAQSGVVVQLVDATGTISKKSYAFGATGDVSAGYGLPHDSDNNGEISCPDVAAGMNDTANDFAKTAKSLVGTDQQISDVPGSTSPAAASGKPVCESSWSNPLSWLMCAVFNMFAEASDAFYSKILQPFLYTSPVDTDSNSPSFKAWSNFRVIANIFLVIIMLIVVFGQAIGGGLVDAYTAKKIMPRLLVGAILINLSVYLVAIMVDLTNVAGSGISRLLLAPFDGIGGFKLSGAMQGGGLALVLGSGIAGAGAIAGFLTAGLSVFPLIIFTLVLPAFFAMLGVFVTLIIRRGIILALVITSPIAFALYCLPNTEKYFRKWWELLFKTLLVYPIIMSIFAISTIMSLMIVDANGNSGASSLSGIVAFALQIIPLFLVPYAFKLSGGAVGNLHNTLTGMGQKGSNLLKSRREQAQKNYNSRSIQGRQELYQKGQDMQKTGGFVRKRTGRLLAGGVGGYNIEAATSAQRAETSKVVGEQIAAGRDEEVRGLTVNKQKAVAGPSATWNEDLSTFEGAGDFGVKSDGTRMFKTLGGAWVSEADVDAGQRRWGRDVFAQQAALSYEMKKASTDDQVQHITDKYGDVAAGWGMTKQQAAGAFIGAGFENQATHLEFKHTKLNLDTNDRGRVTGGTASVNGAALATEMYEKKGSYAVAQMSAHTIQQLGETYNQAVTDGDTQTAQKVQAIAETFMSRFNSGGAGVAGMEGDIPVSGPTGPAFGGSTQSYNANTPGAAHVAEAVRKLAFDVGVYRPEMPPTPKVPSGGPTPTIPPQN